MGVKSLVESIERWEYEEEKGANLLFFIFVDAMSFLMVRPMRVEYPGAYYHVTARGNERKAVFENNWGRPSCFSHCFSSILLF